MISNFFLKNSKNKKKCPAIREYRNGLIQKKALSAHSSYGFIFNLKKFQYSTGYKIFYCFQCIWKKKSVEKFLYIKHVPNKVVSSSP